MSSNAPACIDSRMTVLDIVSCHRATEAVFKAWDCRAGACICCQALFDPLWQAADRYGLDLDRLVAELNVAAGLPGAPETADGTGPPIHLRPREKQHGCKQPISAPPSPDRNG